MPTASPAQQFVPIKKIRNGVVVLKNKTLLRILMTSTTNFALKSEDERKSIMFQFQNFLNSLDFSIQVCIQSRKLDIRPYLNLLDEQQKQEMNELLKIQTSEYIEFIREFTEKTNIMAKRFYVIVPYTPAVLDTSDKNVFGGLKDVVGLGKKQDNQEELDEMKFERQVSQLEERLSVVEQGLTRTGVRTARLGTDELTELFYQTLNPGETDVPTG